MIGNNVFCNSLKFILVFCFNQNVKTNLISIDQETSRLTPSHSMLPYNTHRDSSGGHSPNPTKSGPSGSHLIWGATKVPLELFGLTYNQSHCPKPFVRLCSCQDNWSNSGSTINRMSRTIATNNEKKKSIPHDWSGYSSSVSITHFIMHCSLMSSLEH